MDDIAVISPNLKRLDIGLPYRGYVEYVDEKGIGGWCLAIDDLSRQLIVDIYINNFLVGSTKTGHPRKDISELLRSEVRPRFFFRFSEADLSAVAEALDHVPNSDPILSVRISDYDVTISPSVKIIRDDLRKIIESSAAEIESREVAREFFSEAYYLECNPEVARSGLDPFDHFMIFGWREQRDPSPAFSVKAFLKSNPEMKALGFAAFVDWAVAQNEVDGQQSGKYFHKSFSEMAVKLLKKSFDKNFYLNNYKDLNGSAAAPFEHYMRIGWIERRNPSATFSTEDYLKKHPELLKSGGNPFVHFLLRRALDPDSADDGLPAVAGEVDRMATNRIVGWVWCPDQPEARVDVEVVLEGAVIATAKANLFNEELLQAGVGDGAHAFEIHLTPAVPEECALPQVRPVGSFAGTLKHPSSWSPAFDESGSEVVSPSGAQVFIDWFDARGVSGWAWYPDAPEACVRLEALKDGQVIAQTRAKEMRADLRDAGKGTGLYGFRLAFDTVDPGNASIRLRVPGGAEFPLPLNHVAAPVGTSPRSHAAVEGGVDYLNRRFAIGWAWRPSEPEAVLAVEAILHGKVVGRAVADEMRDDLLKWNKGTGRYGFRIDFESMILEDETPVFRVMSAADEVLGNPSQLPPLSAEERALTTNPGIDHLIAEHARFTNAGPEYEDFDPEILKGMDASKVTAKPLVIAYYLPQFHAIPENDHFWGKGFTEWRQLARAMPRFPGHYQPRIPRDLGFYDLGSSDVLSRQAELAKAAGVGAFCYYYYWFNTRRVLERPLEAHLRSDVDMPFTIMWANENWTRTWDGSEDSVLLRQDYKDEDEDDLLADFAKYFSDPRYVRLNNRPLFFIYNVKHLPNAPEMVARWRDKLRTVHNVDPLIFMAQTFEARDPTPYALDGAIEFPPHKLSWTLHGRQTPDAYAADFKGRVIAYEDMAAVSLGEEPQEYPLIKTIVPSWDNDARRPGRGLTLEGLSPAKYQAWMHGLVERAIDNPIEGVPVVAVNAWNEWAEAAYLEPDVYYGAAYLNATARALVSAVNEFVPPDQREGTPGVSVILPCYNHARFLPERIGSILNQSIPPAEIIFLDDASTDDSVAVARELLKDASVPWRIEVNKTNSGNVFRQWLKGISLAKHDLIWIAETDDSVDTKFLANILPAFRKEDVLGAYGCIQCIDPDGRPRNDLEGYYAGLKFHSWNHSGTVTASRSFSHDFAIRNVIPNASGLVFRKPELREDEVERLLQYRFAGDWYFYALVLRGGSLAYRRAAKSYFRVNPASVSRSAFFTERHLEEHRMVLSDIAREYGLAREAVWEHAERLAIHFPDRTTEDLVGVLTPEPVERRLRLCIAAHSFDVGGGEVVPINLANKLKAEGNHVTFLVMESPEEGRATVRHRLRPDIPVVQWSDVSSRFLTVLDDYGIDVFNSHNVSVEYQIFCHGLQVPGVYVASLHGGYETVPDLLTPDFVEFLREQVSVWMTLADKNVEVLRKAGLEDASFRWSFNAVPDTYVEWIAREIVRSGWGIPSDAFVMMICSRAIEGKGWRTAIDVFRRLDAMETERPVHLVLIGDGPLREELKAAHAGEARIHFIGHLDAPMRYFRAFDLSIFPSTYAGETFPMFLMESFAAGLPVVATDIGEIPRIMGTGEVRPGALVSHRLPSSATAEEMARIIATYVDDEDAFRRLQRLTSDVSARFSIKKLASLYTDVAFEEIERRRCGQLELSGEE